MTVSLKKCPSTFEGSRWKPQESMWTACDHVIRNVLETTETSKQSVRRSAQFGSNLSETARVRPRRARLQTPNSVSFFTLTEFRGENSVSSSQPFMCVQKQTRRVFRKPHRAAAEPNEFSLPKQYSARFLILNGQTFWVVLQQDASANHQTDITKSP